MLRILSAALIATTLLSPASAQEPLKVVASFSIIGDFARQVGGDRIALDVLVGSDSDSHAFEPRPQDAASLAKADVILANGANLEAFLPRLIETSGAKAQVIELVKGVELMEAGEDEHHDHSGHDDNVKNNEHDHGEFDPHAFQSPTNAVIYVANIADAFCAADAAGCESYRANADRYSAVLRGLDTELKTIATSIPAEKRTIITSHDAFRYFGRAYDIDFLAAEGLTTEAEPSAADIAKLIDQARHDKASAIFVENISNPRLVEQIAAETGLKLGGSLYSDALTGPDGAAPTYVDMMRHNMRTIAGAIGGS